MEIAFCSHAIMQLKQLRQLCFSFRKGISLSPISQAFVTQFKIQSPHPTHFSSSIFILPIRMPSGRKISLTSSHAIFFLLFLTHLKLVKFLIRKSSFYLSSEDIGPQTVFTFTALIYLPPKIIKIKHYHG